ncbi:hypothetical protein K491DRAFT_200908 [Lophiostoma macrostomum CBS 122681]|uniref:RNA ligase/cyclic nucleotide phosphodiesterase n=1 Tax=Lophiostoma macrostomum CBS 122681 TaxID=1314788 RepID=A0A6A6SQX6_9PLEO|nr:hypothetical protein K491DRAFT_200908 [Lophiostoma macrostomum CBS 122681]
MAEPLPVPVHTANAFEDLSGVSTASFSNPYDALLSACNNDSTEIQNRYLTHRTTRNAQQKKKMLDESFDGVSIDPILLRLSDPTVEPGYVDPRHCLVFWARPTTSVKALISRVQQELLTVAPNLWLMPQPNLHLTALEMTHSKSSPEIQALVSKMLPSIPSICDYTFKHHTRLIKPSIGFDASALALSFVPAASPNDNYTYHHLRRDLYDLCQSTGAQVDSRYVVPSSHLTIGRFITASDFSDDQGHFSPQKMQAFINKIEEINAWLEAEFWPQGDDGKIKEGGEWIVGEEKGLNCRMGTLWYGGGEEVYLGKGF